MKKIKRVIKIGRTCNKPSIGVYTKDGGLEVAYIIKDEQSLNSLKAFLQYVSSIQFNYNVDFEFECPNYPTR